MRRPRRRRPSPRPEAAAPRRVRLPASRHLIRATSDTTIALLGAGKVRKPRGKKDGKPKALRAKAKAQRRTEVRVTPRWMAPREARRATPHEFIGLFGVDLAVEQADDAAHDLLLNRTPRDAAAASVLFHRHETAVICHGQHPEWAIETRLKFQPPSASGRVVSELAGLISRPFSLLSTKHT